MSIYAENPLNVIEVTRFINKIKRQNVATGHFFKHMSFAGYCVTLKLDISLLFNTLWLKCC